VWSIAAEMGCSKATVQLCCILPVSLALSGTEWNSRVAKKCLVDDCAARGKRGSCLKGVAQLLKRDELEQA
jgi:hypothetical protein